MVDTIFIIEDLVENPYINVAFCYKAIGFVVDKLTAEKIVSEAGLHEMIGWTASAIPQKRFKELKLL